MNNSPLQVAAKKPEMSIIRFFMNRASPRMAVLFKEGTS